ncbi:MAG: DEAD/DEAH box helicase [Prevotella sp.]|nr:DEAD/DEAH box helicase [Candidatus Prevotella equi]
MELTTIELQILIIHTLYDTEGNQAKKVKGIMEELTEGPFHDMNQYILSLRGKNLLVADGYNWRTDSYDYSVPSSRLIEVMLFIYEKHPNEVLMVMDAVGKKLQPTAIQKLLWEFITSEFQKLDIENFNEYAIMDDTDVLIPVADDSRFASMLLILNDENFFELIDHTFSNAFNQGSLINTSSIKALIERRSDARFHDKQERLICLCDLYDYVAYGNMPAKLLAMNNNHRILAAIHEAYHGHYDVALEHFKKAVSLNNKRSGYYTSSAKSYLVLDIANFFYVLIGYLITTDEGKKKAGAVIKSSVEQTMAAKVLYSIIFNNGNEKQQTTLLSELVTSKHAINNHLAQLLARYINKEVTRPLEIQWLLLKHEMRKYVPLDKETEERCNAAYGTQGLLTSIYRKQDWETALEELSLLSGGAKGVVKQKEVRIGYFMHDMRQNTVQVRQQSMLKNGTWGAGKQISISTFLNGGVEGMDADDKEIARQARSGSFYSYDFSLAYVLPYMSEESRLYVGHYAPYALVEVTEEMPYITLVHDANGFLIKSNVPENNVESKVIITHRGAASINFIRMTDEQRPYYRRLLSLGRFPNEAEEQLKAFLNAIGGKIEVNSDLIDGGSTLPQIDGDTKLIMQMRPQDKETYIVSLFVRPLENGKIRCTPGEGNEIIIDGAADKRTRVKRDLQKESEAFAHFYAAIAEQCTDEDNGLNNINSTGKEVFIEELLPMLEYAQQNPDRITCEWPEGAQMRIKQRHSTSGWSGAIKKNENGWFEIEGTVELDQGKVVTMAQLLDLMDQSHGRFIKLGEGEFLALSNTLRKQLDQLSTIASRTRGKLQMSPFSAALIGTDTFDGELFLAEDDELKKIRQRIKEASTYAPHVPKELTAKLRGYQKEGYQWMMRLNKWGAGALLADDMGLGKTIQTITFLLAKSKEGPALVIAPASVAPNWKTEFEKFAPSLRITMLNFVGDRTDAIEHAKAGDVVVTTYGLLLSVKEDITKKYWKTICLDEAHIIKNRGAKTSAVAMQLHSDNRIMLTGTPVQNHLGELWNLFQFVNPGLLGSFEDFNRRFIIPIEQNEDKERQHDLDRLVKPFMLRRTKDKVAKELPEKEEIYQHVTLSEEEMLIYEAMRQKAEAMLMLEGGNKVSMNTLAEITRLRQCACDTRLIEKEKGSNDMPGSKITALVELLQTIIESDGRALVFSQFTSYLALVQKALKDVGIEYLYIDGSVDIKTRTKLVNEFQEGKTPVFLISLKAGGLGLNLTGANYVVHMDPWWNPAIEAQATDRAHRIGQKQHVTVYHLIASGTIEEKIQRLHESKKALADNILEATDISHKLTGEELLNLISNK